MSKNLSDIFPPTTIGGGGGGIEEAPKTGKLYARKDEAWEEFETGDIAPGSKDGETLAWSTADAEYMPNDTLIVKGGSAGIGTNNPQTTLDVNGTFRYGNLGIDEPDADAAARPGFYAVQDLNASTNYPQSFINGPASLVTIAGTNINNHTQLAFGQNGQGPAYRHKKAGNIGEWREFVTAETDGSVYISGNVGIEVNNPQTELNIAQADNSLSSGIRFTEVNLGSAWTIGKTDTDGEQCFEFGYAGSNNSDPSDSAVRFTSTGHLHASLHGHFREPDDYWTTTGWYSVGQIGALASGGSGSILLTAGGYRSDGAVWQSLAGSVGASQIQLSSNNGNIAFRGDNQKDDGSDYTLPIRMQIFGTGEVGIGMTPIASTAAAQIAYWQSELDALLEDNPDLEVKAAVRQATDGEFEVMPAEAALAEWMETRAAGDKLQVNGNISASGKVTANKFVSVNSNGYSSGFMSSVGNDNDYALIPVDAAGSPTDGTVSLGRTKVNNATNEVRFKDAYFGGTVNADSFAIPNGTFKNLTDGTNNGAGIASNTNPTKGVFFSNDGSRFSPTVSGNCDIGSKTSEFKDAYFGGTVNADKFVGDGSGLTGLPSSGLDQGTADARYVRKSGNSTVSGTITATDFVATSDERLKDGITPIPVGLIDDIKPVSWDWKDGSGKSAGVVAQQLQAIGLDDYVHESDDGQLGVNYQALTAILLAEVINLKAEVEALK